MEPLLAQVGEARQELLDHLLWVLVLIDMGMWGVSVTYDGGR